VLNTRQWIDAMWKTGSGALRVIVADALPHRLAELAPGDFASFLESCEDSDAAVVRVAVDILADTFLRTIDVQPLLAVIGRETGDFDSPTRLINPASQKRLRFLLKFVVKSALMACGDVEKLSAIREFVLAHIPVLVSAIFSDNLNPIDRTIRKRVYSVLEESGIDQWDEAIGPQDRNNEFFVDVDGVVQRDILGRLYPYVVGYHNGEFRPEWLLPDGECNRLCLQMMTLRPASAVGYIATVLMIAVLHDKPREYRAFLQELLSVKTRAAAHFGSVLVVGISQSHLDRSRETLEILEIEIVPRLLEFGIENDADVPLLALFFATIALDVSAFWPACERILTSIDAAARRGVISWTRTAEVLSLSCFYPNALLGEKVTDFVLSRYDENGAAGVVVDTVVAGLAARSPALAEAVIARHGRFDAGLLDRARLLVTPELLARRDQISYQAGWNGVILRGMTELPRVRYYLIRDLLGGLVQSNSVPEFAREFRRFVINAARDFLLQDGPDDLRLNVAEALAAAETSPRSPGDVWQSTHTPPARINANGGG
jgi:hypothetical protein